MVGAERPDDVGHIHPVASEVILHTQTISLGTESVTNGRASLAKKSTQIQRFLGGDFRAVSVRSLFLCNRYYSLFCFKIGAFVGVGTFHLSQYLNHQAFRFSDPKTNNGGRLVQIACAVTGGGLTHKK